MDMDAVGTFVNDCLEIDGSLSWRLHTKILYETYIKCVIKIVSGLCFRSGWAYG